MPRPAPWIVALGVVLAFASPRLARGEDEDPASLELHAYDVGALVRGHLTFLSDRGPFTALAPERVNDEESPLFGAEAEERVRPLGGVLDLIEAVKVATGESGTWEREGALLAEQGPTRILVRASPATQARVAATLRRLERETLATVEVDVVAFSGEPPPGATVAEAVSRGTVKAFASARVSGLVGAGPAAFHGVQRAYVVDHGVVVAKGAKATNPFVGVQGEGLAVRSRVAFAGERVRLWLEAWVARADLGPARRAAQEPVDLPAVDGRTMQGEWTLAPGAWTWASAAGGTSFALRATVRRHEADGPGAASLRLDARDLGRGVGPIERRRLPIGDLAHRPRFTRGVSIHLLPTGYTPPEAPELPEPEPVFPPDTLLDAVRAAVDPPSWEAEGTGIAVRHGTILVQSDAKRLEAVERLLGALRGRYLEPVRVRTRVLSVPIASVPGGWPGGAPDDAALLAALPGVRVLDRASVSVLPGVRRSYVGGVSRSYVADYDAEIADEATIGNPVVRQVLDGLSLDAWPVRVLEGGAYLVETRVDRSSWRGSRDVVTSHGAIECPHLGLTRIRGDVVVRAGETRVVFAGLDGDAMTFVLLTVTED
jgi:hypothetical protein